MILNAFPLFRPFKEKLRIAIFTRDEQEATDQERAAKLGASKSVALEQAHGHRVIVAREPLARTERADGLITDRPGLALSIRWADCQNFVVYSPEKSVVGLLHVGWRGLRVGIIPEFFRVLGKEFGIKPQETLVGGGPALCLSCSEFTDPGRELPEMGKTFIHGQNADLRGWALQQFHDAGGLPERFERIPDCTKCLHERYWTYRGGDREMVLQGRSNALACILL